MKKMAITLQALFIISTSVMGNNISTANISVTGQNAMDHYCLVQFDLSWDNSWRTTNVPNNWDAAWIFIKYRIFNGPWKHATLSQTNTDHLAPSGSTIDPSPDGKGVFIYRSTNGSGTNVWNGVRLRWNYGDDNVGDDVIFELKVFAIEMVYIPQGPFYLGDGDGTGESYIAFHKGTLDSAVRINTSLKGDIRVDGNPDDDNQIIYIGIGIDGDGGLDWDDDGTIDNALFPTGYMAFYIMKYEISQEQYRDFLNCLTRTQQGNRVAVDISGQYPTSIWSLSNNASPVFRNGIVNNDTLPPAPDPVTFYCNYRTWGGDPYDSEFDGQNIACNILSWPDGAAYADWAGLRPMSEPEYEKACRGPNPAILNEYAWGNTYLWNTNYTIASASEGKADEYITNMGTNTGNANYLSTSNYWGPYRCGIFASSAVNHTRQESGATFYGVMEMSGNLYEPMVALGTAAGRSFTGLHGDGELDTSGFADVDYWPGINSNNNWNVFNGVYGGTNGVKDYAGLGGRGGSSGKPAQDMMTSDRGSATWRSGYSARSWVNGIRLVRTAP